MSKQLTEEEIIDGLNNNEKYLWIVNSPDSRLRTLVKTGSLTLITIVLLPLFFIGFFWYIIDLFGWIGFIVFIFVELSIFSAYIISYWNWFFGKEEGIKESSRQEVPLMGLFAASLLIIIMSSPFFYPNQFQGAVNDPLEWIGFFLDSLFSILLLNIPSYLGLTLSDITVEGWIGNIIVSIYRGILGSAIIYFIIAINRVMFGKEEYYGSFEDFYNAYALLSQLNMMITIKGRIVNLDPLLTCDMFFFNDTIHAEWKKKKKQK